MYTLEQFGHETLLNRPEPRAQSPEPRTMTAAELVDRLDETTARLTCVARLLSEADVKSMHPTEESIAGLVLILNDAVKGLRAVAATLERQGWIRSGQGQGDNFFLDKPVILSLG